MWGGQTLLSLADCVLYGDTQIGARRESWQAVVGKGRVRKLLRGRSDRRVRDVY